MRIDPALRALRSEPTPQRIAQDVLFAARDAWRERDDWKALSQDIESYGNGADLGSCAALAALFADPARAGRFAREFTAHFLPAIAKAPLAQFPSRHIVNGSVSTLLLAAKGRAVLSLVAFDGETLAGRPRAQTVGFSDGERHEMVLAGRGSGLLVRGRELSDKRMELSTDPLDLVPGFGASIDTSRESIVIDGAEGRLVTLRLLRMTENPRPIRDYALADGAFLHQSAGETKQSRLELMIALLGRMRRADAAPLMAAMAIADGAAVAPHLRWQALRECIALDTAEGFRALCRIARDEEDPLVVPAGALRAQLIESHPVLLGLEEKELTCPA